MVDHARRGPGNPEGVPRWTGRGPGNPEGVPRWTGRGPGNPEGVPRSIRLPESARAKERPGGRTIAAVGGLPGTGVMAGPSPGCPLTRDGSGDGHYQPWRIGRGSLAPAPAEVALGMELSRRQFLAFVGVTGGAAAADALLATAAVGADGSVGDFLGRGATPVRLPHQLPIYLSRDSFLPTTGQVGDFGAPLAEYIVLDDVIVAPEFERYLVVAWGDRVFDDRDQYVGYNCDYTAFRRLHVAGDGFLWVNHEYVSFPISLGAP